MSSAFFEGKSECPGFSRVRVLYGFESGFESGPGFAVCPKVKRISDRITDVISALACVSSRVFTNSLHMAVTIGGGNLTKRRD